jgi:Zn-finger nucleic acid-binding protein
MLCPHCKIDLQIISLNNTKIDICPTCQGIWLDKNEILKLINTEKETLRDALRFVEIDSKKDEKLWQNEIECPKCHKLMQKFPYAGSSDIVIDSCRDGCGIWLDKGEIFKIADYLSNTDKPLTDTQKKQNKENLAQLNKTKMIGEILNKRYYSENDLMADLDNTPAGNYMGIISAILQGLIYLLFRRR